MELSVIQIGNSKGFRLSKTILEKYNIKDTIELIMEKGYIILKPAKVAPRKNWDKAFKAMHKNGDDKPLMADIFQEESFEEWK